MVGTDLVHCGSGIHKCCLHDCNSIIVIVLAMKLSVVDGFCLLMILFCVEETNDNDGCQLRWMELGCF